MLHSVNYKLQNGIALLTALLFMQIIMMLGFYALQASLILNKLSEQSWHSTNTSVAMDAILRKAESDILRQNPNCQIPVMNRDDLLAKSMDWWRSSISCAGNFYALQYYYVFEFLGEDPCAFIDQFALNSIKNEIAAYYRVTILVTSINEINAKSLQSTLVKAVSSEEQCHERQHTVAIGRQMWREFK